MNNLLLNLAAVHLIADILEAPVNPYRSHSGNSPLVADGWGNLAYVGALVLVICLIVVVRLFSKQLDNAIVFSLVLSLVAITAFMLLT